MGKKSFKERVLNIVSKIPKGKVLTYQKVAEKAGNSRAARAVGNIMHQNSNPQVFCHRVIRTDGKIGGYRDGTKKKRALLIQEGYLKK